MARKVEGDAVAMVLIPGSTVRLERFGMQALVVPFGIRHLRKFGALLAALLRRAGEMDLRQVVKGATNTEEARQKFGARFGAELAPLLTGELMDLMVECVTLEWLPAGELDELVKAGTLSAELRERIGDGSNQVPAFEELPHDALPPVLEAWAIECFGTEDRRRPWVAVIDRAMTTVTGKPFSISETWSSLRSPPDTTEPTSSTDGNPDSRTQDGHGPSSPSGQSAPVPEGSKT